VFNNGRLAKQALRATIITTKYSHSNKRMRLNHHFLFTDVAHYSYIALVEKNTNNSSSSLAPFRGSVRMNITHIGLQQLTTQTATFVHCPEYMLNMYVEADRKQNAQGRQYLLFMKNQQLHSFKNSSGH
jgi:hypothetical protein